MLTLAALLLGVTARADEPYEPAPAHRLHYNNATFARINPLGLVDQFRVGWRARLSSRDSTLLRDTYSFVGANVIATPAYSRLGLYAEAQVLAVLRVFGEVDGVGYYGTFDQVLSWDDPTARYSDRALSDLGAAGAHAATTGWVWHLGGTLRAAVGPVAVRSTAQVTQYDLSLPDGDTVFYDQFWDRLAPDGGLMILNDADVLVVLEHARIGVRHTVSAGLDDAPGDGGIATHRVGPLLAWQFFDDAPGARFNQPTAFLLTQWWVQHPYRTGGEQPAGLPLIAAGFAFNGDLAVTAD